MYTIHGKQCPVLGAGELVAVSCSGSLVAVPSAFPGSRRPGILFVSQEQAHAFKCELYAAACERTAESCEDAGMTTGRYLQAEQCREAAHLSRTGDYGAEVVVDVIRYSGVPEYQWEMYGLTLPEGAIDC